MATLFNLPKAVPVDSSGQPYPGAKLYFYAAGTTTAQLVYIDVDITTPHAQPVVADASGRFSFNLVCTKAVGETVKKYVGAE